MAMKIRTDRNRTMMASTARIQGSLEIEPSFGDPSILISRATYRYELPLNRDKVLKRRYCSGTTETLIHETLWDHRPVRTECNNIEHWNLAGESRADSDLDWDKILDSDSICLAVPTLHAISFVLLLVQCKMFGILLLYAYPYLLYSSMP